MQDSHAHFDALRQSGDAATVQALEALIQDGDEEDLAHLNALRVAAEHGLDEEAVIATLLHAARLGLFEMSWNILCSSCGGVLDANATLKSVRQQDYHCAFCALDSEPVLDDAVEVSFAVSPHVRRIAAHDPEALAFWDYHRQVFFGTGVVFPEADVFRELARLAMLETVEVGAGEQTVLDLQVAAGTVTLFDPVTHTAHVLDVEGEPGRESKDRPQDVTLVFKDMRPPVGRTNLRPGLLRLTLDNRSEARVLVGAYVLGDHLQGLIGRRRPFLTAKRLLSNQTFRDLYRTQTLDIEQRFKITSLAFLFTDLKGSTALYERVGDLVAYDLVRAHFHILEEIVAAEGGAVVKTIGDAVMATFPTPRQAVAAALRIRETMTGMDARGGAEPLIVKIGLHVGPCLAVHLNDRQDFFGQTVNIAWRVQELATSEVVFATEPVVGDEAVAGLLADKAVGLERQTVSLRGVSDRVPVYALS